MLNKTYAGIGSRETPISVLNQMVRVGSFLGQRNFTLRSGGAKGADSAFERGCDLVKGKKQIWMPSEDFFPLHEWATEKASSVCWEFPLEKMKGYTIKLITRNMFQIFGDKESFKESTPVDFVVYWSKGNPLEKGRESGGTRYAVRVAHEAGIPTFNLRTQKEEYALFLKEIKKDDARLKHAEGNGYTWLL
jgi:hypothetical protein